MMDSYPLHDFSKDDESSISFRLDRFGNKSVYDIGVPHRHNYYEVFIFTGSGGSHLIDFAEFPVTTGTIQFVSPGQVHQLRRTAGSGGWFLGFSRDFYYLNSENKDLLFDLPFLNNNSSRPVVDVPEGEFKFFTDLVENIEREYNSASPFREELIRSFLNILLIHSRRLFKDDATSKKTPGQDIFTRFRILLEKKFTHQHRPSEYADNLSITEKHLNEVVKSMTGLTVGDVIQERLMLEAQRLLLHSGLSTKEIAFFLHFEDPSYFTKVFKRNTGLTPGQFQDEAKKKFE
jgi:AraC family transcriptional regulator, transcriptional activator of pobA